MDNQQQQVQVGTVPEMKKEQKNQPIEVVLHLSKPPKQHSLLSKLFVSKKNRTRKAVEAEEQKYALSTKKFYELLAEAEECEPIKTETERAKIASEEFRMNTYYSFAVGNCLLVDDLQLISIGEFSKSFYGIQTRKTIFDKEFFVQVRYSPYNTPNRIQLWEIQMQKEIHYLHNLKHENIVKLVDFAYIGKAGFANGREVAMHNHICALKMEFLDKNFGSLIETGRLRMPIIERCAKQMASALSYMHERNLSHNNVKPANIMINGIYRDIKDHMELFLTSTFKLIDFQNVEFHNDGSDIDLINSVSRTGTEFYWCKEKKCQAGSYNPFKADVYSLGFSMLEAYFGSELFARVVQSLIDSPSFTMADMIQLDGPKTDSKNLKTFMTMIQSESLRPHAKELISLLDQN